MLVAMPAIFDRVIQASALAPAVTTPTLLLVAETPVGVRNRHLARLQLSHINILIASLVEIGVPGDLRTHRLEPPASLAPHYCHLRALRAGAFLERAQGEHFSVMVTVRCPR